MGICYSRRYTVVVFWIYPLACWYSTWALDHLVDQKIQETHQAKFSQWKFHLQYLATIVVYIILWKLFPVASFVFFLLISAFHFGETDLSFPKSSLQSIFLQVLYGAILLLIFLFVYRDNTRLFASETAAFTVFIEMIVSWMRHPYFFGAWAFLVFLFGLVYMLYMPSKLDSLFFIVGRLFFIYVTARLLPFPISFTIYFGLWHSVISLSNIKSFMTKDQGVTITWIQLFQKAAPLALVSIFGLLCWLLFLYNIIILNFIS